MARNAAQSRQHIVDTLTANGGTMSYADLRENMQDRDFKQYSRMKAQGEVHNFWVTEELGQPAALHVSLEPRDNVTVDETPPAPVPPAQ